jgi:N-methylhydantoinase B
VGARQVGEILYVDDHRWWCNGEDLGPVTASYKAHAIVRDTQVCELGPEYHATDRTVADRFVLREFICPVTGYRIDTEIALVDEQPRHDVMLGVTPT